MLTYASIWAIAVFFSVLTLAVRSSELVSALVWGEVVWVCFLVLCGILSVTSGDLSLLFVCIAAMCVSAIELAIVVSLVSSKVS